MIGSALMIWRVDRRSKAPIPEASRRGTSMAVFERLEKELNHQISLGQLGKGFVQIRMNV